MTGRCTGRVVLITGGGSGIGAAAARAFAAEGAAAVIIAGRRMAEGQQVVEVVERAGGQGRFVQTDVTDPAQQEALIETVMREFGRLDIAFNNAGYQEKRALLADQDDETYCRVFDTNVRAVFHGMRLQIRAMLASGGGAIINNASVSGMRNPNPGLSLYSASKAAVVSLTRSAALEYAGQGIRVNAVAPGRVITDMMLRSGIADMSVVAAGLPLKRMGTAEEVAEAVVWLASDASAYVVGHVLCTDGGFMAG